MTDVRPTIFLPSVLVGLLKHAGPLVAPRAAASLLQRAGRHREVFLPFFYRWFDDRQWAQDQALRLLQRSVEREGTAVPRVFHAPFTGRYGPLAKAHRRDLADPRRLREHQRALVRECAFFGRVRRECNVRERVIYILHLGLRGERTTRDALRTAVEAIRPAAAVAQQAGVVLALENVADRFGDEGFVGARLPEIGEALDALGATASGESPLGWTFDLSHALLSYRFDARAIDQDLRHLKPALVHLHVNAPRLHLSETAWADRHEAPTEGFRPLWDLFRLALTSERFQEFRGITYEVNWAAPLFSPLVGGSPLAAVARGYDLVQRVAAEAFSGPVDTDRAIPHTLERAETVEKVPAGVHQGALKLSGESAQHLFSGT